MIRLVLPYPVSTNRYWRTYQPRGFKAPVTTLSEEAKAYKREVGLLARAAGVRQPLQGFVRVSMWLVPHAPLDVAKRMRAQPQTWPLGVQSLDLGNCEKVVCDALNGIAWADDRQIEDLHIRRAPPGQKGLIVEFEEFVPEWLQAPDLFGKAAAMAASAQDRQMRRRSSLLLTGRAGSDSETGSTSRTTARPVLGG